MGVYNDLQIELSAVCLYRVYQELDTPHYELLVMYATFRAHSF